MNETKDLLGIGDLLKKAGATFESVESAGINISVTCVTRPDAHKVAHTLFSSGYEMKMIADAPGRHLVLAQSKGR
jgi:hypothetical protein